MNNIELGPHGRSRSNVWKYAGVNSFRAGRLDELKAHPTAKPVALIADALKDCTKRGDIALDTFSGAGTSILAAERVGRRAYALELEPCYVDVAIRRWQASPEGCHLAETGTTFDELGQGHDPRETPGDIRVSEGSMGGKSKSPVEEDDDDYEIGYGRPPRHTQSSVVSRQRQGLSTRPTQCTDRRDRAAERADQDQGPCKARTVSMLNAIVRLTISNALKGDPKSCSNSSHRSGRSVFRMKNLMPRRIANGNAEDETLRFYLRRDETSQRTRTWWTRLQKLTQMQLQNQSERKPLTPTT